MSNMGEFIGAALVGAASALGLAALVGRAKNQEEVEEKKEKGIVMMCGELVDMHYDKETGFTKLYVRDENGVTQTGYSTLSIGELAALYSGRGYVQIPTHRI